jgi:hypothetical protein
LAAAPIIILVLLVGLPVATVVLLPMLLLPVMMILALVSLAATRPFRLCNLQVE